MLLYNSNIEEYTLINKTSSIKPISRGHVLGFPWAGGKVAQRAWLLLLSGMMLVCAMPVCWMILEAMVGVWAIARIKALRVLNIEGYWWR